MQNRTDPSSRTQCCCVVRRDRLSCRWLFPVVVRCLLIGAILAGSLIGRPGPVLGGPLVGDIISTQASSTYFDGTDMRDVTSNVVQSKITYLASIVLDPTQARYGTPGLNVHFPHILKNTGNGNDSFQLTAALTGGNTIGLDPATIRVHIDANLDGTPDSTTNLLGTSLPLSPGQATGLLVTVLLPPGAVAGQDGTIRLTAASLAQPAVTATADDTVKVATGPLVKVGKSLSVSSGPSPGSSEITVTLDFANTGIATATALTLTDVLPTGMGYVPDSGQLNAAAQTDAADGDGFQADPANRTVVANVGDLAAGANGRLTFRITIDGGLDGGVILANRAAYSFLEASTDVQQTNTAVYQVVGAQASEWTSPNPLDLPFAVPGEVVVFRNVFKNTGTTTDRFNLTIDADGSTFPVGTLFYLFREDGTTPFADSNKDGIVDTGPLAAGADIIVKLQAIMPTLPMEAVGPFTVSVNASSVLTAAAKATTKSSTKSLKSPLSAAAGPPMVVVDRLLRIVPNALTFYTDSSLSTPTTTGARGAPLFLGLMYNGCNLDAARAETVPVTLTSRDAKDAENGFLLQETGLGTSIFSLVNVPTRTWPDNPQVADNNIVETSHNDLVTATVRCGARVLSAQLVMNPDEALDANKLTLQKEASRETVRFGETVQYRLVLNNLNTSAAHSDRIDDYLPPGFSYVKGTARLDGEPLTDPVAIAGNGLRFTVPNLDPQSHMELTYRLRVGAGAQPGSAENRARYFAFNPSSLGGLAVSNLARSEVTVDMGIFSDLAFVVGKVFTDCNANGMQDPGEVGVPGVRLIMETGDFVITDEEGKYSFYGLEPRTHVLRVDNITLPRGAMLIVLDNRNAGDPMSRFVDLKKGELHRADFTLGQCAEGVMKEIDVRRNAQVKSASELVGSLKGAERGNPLIESGTVDALTRPSSGVISREGKLETLEKVYLDRSSTTRDIAMQPEGVAAQDPTVNFQSLMPTMKEGFDFYDLKDGDTLPRAQISVRIKGPAGGAFELLVNDQLIPASRVGQKSVMKSRNLQAWEYIGVPLPPGKATLTARLTDGFGNVRESKTIHVTVPGKSSMIEILGPKEGSPADGATPAHLVVRLTDEKGTPVSARTPLTLETSLGTWDVEDFDPKEPGVQTFIEGGEAAFDLRPPITAGKAVIRVSSGTIESAIQLDFLPHLRPLIAVGVIEGAIGLSQLDSTHIRETSDFDAFEREIKSFHFGDGDLAAGGRSALFLKGKVKGDYLLTLAYDSDKDTNDRLFRDIRPDQFYPVYGDSSVRGFDAQSTSQLYVRVDKGKSYVLYGDYTTMQSDIARTLPVDDTRLGRYTRSLNGASSHYENDRVSLNFFAAQSRSTQRVSTFRALGVSGPYPVDFTGWVRNSERVELLTVDRQQPSLVIASTTLTRFSDYTVDDLGNSILFTGPISGVDDQLNPVFIRVTWEVESSDLAWVYGFNGNVTLTDWLIVGGTYARDEHPEKDLKLMSAHGTVRLGDKSCLVAEVAQSEDRLGTTGQAGRIEVLHKMEVVETRAYALHTDKEFSNPSSSISAGRNEIGISSSQKLFDKFRTFQEVVVSKAVDGENQSAQAEPETRDFNDIYSSETSTSALYGNDRTSAMAGIEYQVHSTVKGRVAGRYTNEQFKITDSEEGEIWTTRETDSVLGRIDWQPWFFPKFNTYFEYEQAVNDEQRKMLGVGFNYQIMSRAKLYGRHEFISTLDTFSQGFSDKSQVNPALGLIGSDRRDRQTSTMGIKYDYLDNHSLFSEYRAIGSGINGPEAEASMGLRDRWVITPQLKFFSGIERIHPLMGETDQSTAISGGVTYGDEKNWLSTARLEWRGASESTSWLSTVGYASKLTRDLTWLASNAYYRTENDKTSDVTVKDRLRTGFAWRQTSDNVWNLLALYEYKLEDSDSDGESRHAHIWSLHENVKLNRRLVLSGRYAGELVTEDTPEYSDTFMAHLISCRATYDLTDKFDLGLGFSTLFEEDFQKQQNMFGLEAGYLMADNFWLTVGYNLIGFHTDDLAGDEITTQGPYFRIRMKFDEGLFKWLQ